MAKSRLQALVAAAKRASRRAYCPYSGFRVGAAVLGQSGAIAAGCNVENASYGLTICAERSAVAQLISTRGERDIRMVVIYTPTATPTGPCGGCRQVLNEFGPNMRVLCVCDGPERIDATLNTLLPTAFGPRNLE
jgi:cytidine deaminase